MNAEPRRSICEDHKLEDLKLDESYANTVLQATADVSAATIAESSKLGRIGQYELLSEIARGGMGVVYKARQAGLNRIVALKMTLAGAIAGEEERRRFQVEAETAGRLNHPGIVPIYEIGEHDGLPFFSMSFVEGPSLKALLADGPLPPRRAAELLASMADAVEYAHSQGIVHRDLKPQNVLIDTNGRPHITDFGLARQVATDSNLTATGQVLGTPSFMPPEQAAGRISDIGPTSDVYSLGATLYCLITGRPPFQAANVIDTLKQVCETEPAPPRLINPEIDHDLQTICLKCLRKEQNQRYASAAELADDLRHFLKGEPIEAHSLNLLERVAWTLERSRDVREFAPYSRLFFTFAAIVLVIEMVGYKLFLDRVSVEVFAGVQSLRFVQFGLAIWHYRREGLLPRNATERLLWSIWIGYILACIADSTAYQMAHGWDGANASHDFPHLASITGLAFFVMGSVYFCCRCDRRDAFLR
ncbi:MAG: serine/threonine protein kinase [Planctomycetaceae bacterium]